MWGLSAASICTADRRDSPQIHSNKAQIYKRENTYKKIRLNESNESTICTDLKPNSDSGPTLSRKK